MFSCACHPTETTRIWSCTFDASFLLSFPCASRRSTVHGGFPGSPCKSVSLTCVPTQLCFHSTSSPCRFQRFFFLASWSFRSLSFHSTHVERLLTSSVCVERLVTSCPWHCEQPQTSSSGHLIVVTRGCVSCVRTLLSKCLCSSRCPLQALPNDDPTNEREAQPTALISVQVFSLQMFLWKSAS